MRCTTCFRFSPCLLAGFLIGLLPGSLPHVWAQSLPFPMEVPLPGVTGYDSSIPKPEEVIGHQIGTKHTEPHQVVAYFEAVAAASDRVVLREHGRTYEGRPLIHAVITSPANHERLEAIRAANLRLSEAPGEVGDDELATMPVVLYQGYSIHGNEASGTEAAVLYLYHLAAGQGPAVEDALESAVVLLDPLFNPDGRNRFTTWVNRNRGAVATADPQDREHNEPWPGGRTNHYWFDLNRDWLPAQHPESRGRLALFHHWRPQVLTDHHEMGGNATYFFQPGVPSRTHPLTPPLNQELTAEIATYHGRALDRIGSLYYTEESFDDFYYGKGSTYPDVNGAVGILFEQASSRALKREVVDGTLDYAFTVRNQFATSLSTLEAAVHLRERLLRYQRDFYAGAADVARRLPVKAYVIGLEPGRTRAQALAELLLRHRIRVHELARDVQAEGKTFRAGQAYVVPLDQPQVRLVQAMMERVHTFEDSLFYDVSTWTLPLAFDVPHAALRQAPDGLLGPALTRVTRDGGRLVGGRSEVAYVMRWNRYFAPRALYKLQAAGVRPRLMPDPFTVRTGGQEVAFERGAVIIPVVGRDGPVGGVHDLVARLVEEDHVEIYAVEAGLTPAGPDLGGPGTTVLEQPRLALITGDGTSAYDAGEVWHLLTERFRIPVTLLDADRVARADLNRYNTLILAGGSYDALPGETVKAWVRGGGRLIALGSAAGWVLRQELARLEEKPFNLDSLLRGLPYDRLDEARGAQVIGGTIFEVVLDTTHPLAFGLGPTLPVFRDHSTFYRPAEEPGTNVGVYAEAPVLSGYISRERLAQASGSAAVVARRYGRGRVVLIMDNPNFRAFWWGSNRLFLNALFFGGAF
ncbi:MAG: peptidase M14 [Rhodothermaceae bacterium]|nr:MAG: peptidase M14 [Rhodothermaceae bacterium]